MRSGRTYLAPLAALGGVLAAASCCLPVGTMFLAAGSAGAGALLRQARPFLMTLSVLLVLLGFWQAARAGQCGAKPNYLSLALLWLAALFTGLSLVAPQALADLLAG